MASKPSPIDIMNVLGSAAHRKAQPNVNPEDEEDPLNSAKPSAPKSPASVKSKQVGAMKAQEKGQGKLIPNKNY